MSAKRADATRAPANPQTTDRLFLSGSLPNRRKPRARLPGVFRLALALLLLFTITQNTFAHGQRGDVGDLYVANTRAHNVLQFNGLTGEFVCIFAVAPPDLQPHEFRPFDLIFAPNGHLWVASSDVVVVGFSYVAEYDGHTGDFRRYVIGPDQGGAGLSSLSVGGPDGDLYVLQSVGPHETSLHRFDAQTGVLIDVVLRPTQHSDPPGPSHTPVMVRPENGRFDSQGRFLLTGETNGVPVPIFRRYDRFFEIDDNGAGGRCEFIGNEQNQDIIESPDGLHYVVANRQASQIDLYDKATCEFAGTLVTPASIDGCGLGVPPCYESMQHPYDLAYGPNGHLFVIAAWTPVPVTPASEPFLGKFHRHGAVHEFDPVTGEQIRRFGGFDAETPWNAFAPLAHPERLYHPVALEFKPLPGDWGGSGMTYQGDWNVDEADLDCFLAALEDNRRTVGSESPLFLAANLLSFDFDRNGTIDCADWPPFAAAFEASRGYAPSPPLPETSVFIDALLGDDSAVCVSDCNADGTVDGQDIASYLAAVLEG